MLLYRISVVRFGCEVEDTKIFNRVYGGVNLMSGNRENESGPLKNEFVLTAFTRINEAPVCKDLYWDIPAKERSDCEKAIEYVSALIGVKYRTSHEIWSPSGFCVALKPETENEKGLLDSCQGFRDARPNMNLQAGVPLDVLINDRTFADRSDGILLMSEALSHSTASGSFRDYIRLFENAFSSPTLQLKKKLVQFLPREMGYSNQEIQGWINLRDPLSHADNRKTKKTLYATDVAPVINRVQQAAYDVLFIRCTGVVNQGCEEMCSLRKYITLDQVSSLQLW